MSNVEEESNRATLARNVRKNILANKRTRSPTDNFSVLSNTSQQLNQELEEHASPICEGRTVHNDSAKRARILRKEILQGKHTQTETEYLDLGDPNSRCQFCGAMMWYEERINKKIKNKPPTFSVCCSNGKVQLPRLQEPPLLLRKLLFGRNSKSTNFLKNIRAYNMMFSFTSMGGKIDHSINRGKAPYVFKIQGSNYHRIGSLLPDSESEPKFAQLYIYDTSNEVQNRIDAIRGNGSSGSNHFDSDIIKELKNMLDEFNPLAKNFRMARERIESDNDKPMVMRLIEKRNTDGRMYNLPTVSEVAALIPGDIDVEFDQRDIILQERNGGSLQRISELHPSYLALQYPLLFPYGEDGYRLGILHKDASSTSRQRVKLTMREFFAYRIQERLDDSRLISHSRRLYQQFLVDAFTMIESERLLYIRTHQVQLRTDSAKNIQDAVEKGQTESSSTGKRIIPSSYTGGTRYMIQNYQDAMAICKWLSYPDLFITFTCNPKWPEITRFLEERGLKAEDRPDIVCRLFKMKLDNLIKDFKENHLFGKIQAIIYTIEFQKRGLPHAHILLFLHRDNKIPSPEDVDRIIFAEIPDENMDMQLHELVKDLMMHGPCGVLKPTSPYMIDRKCSKRFPKKYNERTTVDEEGYPLYKRRDNGCTLNKDNIEMGNGFVVPYNPILLKRYQAHINVEWCNQHRSIKYLFKYINKGHDRVTAEVSQKRKGDKMRGEDEIKNHINCRYISPCEAVWRTLGYEIHLKNPAVQRLSFHLPGEQNIIFEDEDSIDSVLNKPGAQRSMFMAWFEANKKYPWARELTYVEFPTKFVWKSKEREWSPRQQRLSLGRLLYVPPGTGEMYYLGILIHHCKGAFCYQDIRTIHGVIYPTFKDACYSMGLLNDDKEYIDGIKEASFWASGHYLRNLFVILLISNSMSSPEVVFDKTFEYLSEDILHMHRRMMNMEDLQLSDEQIKNYTLIEIEKSLHQNGSTLKRFESMPFPDQDISNARHNKLIHEELQYNKSDLKVEHDNLFSTLTTEQKGVYEEIIEAVVTDKGGIFFLYGFGGTGKTFIWKTLSAYVRSQGHIVLNVASSGIAALLLPGGRTAHSRFAIPLDVNENSTCQIKPGTELAELIAKAKLIIWDEAPMTKRYCFEALDKSLRDIIRDSSNTSVCKPFGGKTIVFGGDFRQILPVIPKGSREDIVYATINSSYLWKSCKVLRLTKNMRLQSRDSSCDESDEQLRKFSDWILKVGDGDVGEYNDGYSEIEIPEQNLIMDAHDPIEAIVNALYPSIDTDFCHPSYFEDRAILAPTHKVVETINEHVLSKIPGEEKVYLSSDSVCKASGQTFNNEELFSVDFLNSVKCSGIPNHRLILKIGVPIILLRNIDQKGGLCNGTRLIVTKLGNHVLEARIISGRNIGNKVYIPRMILSPSDHTTPVKFQRRQFPVLLCFAMTINKSQGQTLSNVGLFLPKPVFTHGQLYVAISRVKSQKGLKILCLGDDEKPSRSTINVVFKEVFQNLN